MRALQVEDDTMIGNAVHKGLLAEQYAVDWCKQDGQLASTALNSLG